MICVKSFESPARMMIDTDVGENLMKRNDVNPELPVDEKILLKLTGMNDSPLLTMGQVQINILRYPTILNIIPNEVSIDKDAVQGSEFFQENKGNINYVSKCLGIQNDVLQHSIPSIDNFPMFSRQYRYSQ